MPHWRNWKSTLAWPRPHKDNFCFLSNLGSVKITILFSLSKVSSSPVSFSPHPIIASTRVKSLRCICPLLGCFFTYESCTNWSVSQPMLTSEVCHIEVWWKCPFRYTIIISYWECLRDGNSICKGLEAGKRSGGWGASVAGRLSARASWVHHDQLCELRQVRWCPRCCHFCELGQQRHCSRTYMIRIEWDNTSRAHRTMSGVLAIIVIIITTVLS